MIDRMQERYSYYLAKWGPDIPVAEISKDFFGYSPEYVQASRLPIASYKMGSSGQLYVCAYELAAHVTKLADSASVLR